MENLMMMRMTRFDTWRNLKLQRLLQDIKMMMKN
ncbi:hypothetical protein Pint_30886 [Pistacia integerrima]|uniref:Uncharacterized protein n=1 Tax=Pistacia integerrima TaxID=434235 RepID=A0ACC0XQL0_9ROSI|nr:hypothetical protein Pint_30886 [Pistacia integerrima]